MRSSGGVLHGLKLREDATRGVYVEGITQEELRQPEEALAMLVRTMRKPRLSNLTGLCSAVL